MDSVNTTYGQCLFSCRVFGAVNTFFFFYLHTYSYVNPFIQQMQYSINTFKPNTDTVMFCMINPQYQYASIAYFDMLNPYHSQYDIDSKVTHFSTLLSCIVDSSSLRVSLHGWQILEILDYYCSQSSISAPV